MEKNKSNNNNKKHFQRKKYEKNETDDTNDKNNKVNKSQLEELEIEELNKRIRDEVPPTGYYFNQLDGNKDDELNLDLDLVDKTNKEGDSLWKKPKVYFKELPISKRTIRGLSDGKFFKMTPIQRASLPHSLCGRDILGASKTGSGKTLCFVIAVLESLFKHKWSGLDGMGALIILPTRELSIQVFEVLKIVGKYHDFSCGLVIGGNNLDLEKDNLYRMNILIGTPGRILQHMAETPYFTSDNLKMLVIDEADRILDDGFEETVAEILSYLPTSRQSLLFSATLTKSLKRLAKLNMKSPEYINLSNTDAIIDNILPNETKKQNDLSILTPKDNTSIKDNLITPINLNQFYTIVEPHEKINILYSFLNSHKNSKCLVFLSSCKQVRFFFEIFKKLKLGMTFLDLHGRQKQTKRSNMFYTFLQKRNTVLFATDVASRGVDFPAIDWVIQLDCPEDLSTYIHRVGRTARYKSQGNSIIFVSKREEKFIEVIKNKSIQIKRIKVAQNKIINLEPVVRSIVSENKDLTPLAEKAFSSYVRSISIMPNKEIFDVKEINLEKLCLSFGLVASPEVVVKKNTDDDEMQEDDVKLTRKQKKLQKLKDKIAIKKMQNYERKLNQPEEVQNNNIAIYVGENENENEFLKEKRKSDNIVNIKIKKPEPELIKEVKVLQKNEKILNTNTEEEDYYEKIKKRLSQNAESDKIKEKLRIMDKHKNDRIRRKQRDYEKHGHEITAEDNSELPLNEEEESENDHEHEENIETSKPQNDDNKLKINLRHATLEEKEKATLELLQRKNNLFA
jgi:ATP-dependent RNA helicase DDX10/DBP4